MTNCEGSRSPATWQHATQISSPWFTLKHLLVHLRKDAALALRERNSL